MAAICLMALAACNSDEAPQQEPPRYEIHFTTGVAPMDLDATMTTRAAGNYTNYVMGQKFWTWATMFDAGENTTTDYFDAWGLTISSVTSKFNTNSGSTKMFPAYNKLSFYTLHGNFAQDITEDETTFPTMLTHSVKTTQQSDADYQVSDLVYAINKNVTPSASAVVLDFFHLLSQVEVALVPGNGITADELTSDTRDEKATVSLLTVKTCVEFRPDKDGDLTTAETRALMLQNASEVDTITISTVPTDNILQPACGAAVVVPQTVNGNFIRINYLGYDTFVKVSNLQLKSGYRYRFNVTVDRLGGIYQMTPVTVAEWTAADDKPRVAELK